VRVLHPVQPDEKLVCRGRYQYFADGRPTGDVEVWLVTALPDGSQIVRADIDGAQGSTASLVSHLHRHPDGRPEWLRIRYRRGGTNAAAQYTFEEASVRMARLVEGYPRSIELLEIAANYVLDYHPVIAHDYVWRGYPANAGGEGRSIPVFSPDLWAEGDAMLKGRALRVHVRPLIGAPCATLVGEFTETRHFAITMNDGVEALAWYDEQGTPLRWVYPGRGYDFNLADYQRADA
jgi:hypothetical protein